jgi:hypothetical protein
MNNKVRPSTKQNNMYTDRRGNVYQRNSNGSYDNKSNRTRQQIKQTPATRQQPSQPQNRQQLDRSYQNRNRGTQNYNRTQQYNRSRVGGRPAGRR